MRQALHIGSAAKQTGLSIDTIRFYQKLGLLKPPARTAGGYRVFSKTEVAELQFIAKAHDLGFSLAEIKELLSLRNENGRACPEVRDLIHRKLQNVREKIFALKQLESELARGLRSCDRALKRPPAHSAAVQSSRRSQLVERDINRDPRDTILPRLSELSAGR